MSASPRSDWQEEFGIERARSQVFFQNKSDLGLPGSAKAQTHILRRAFDLLMLDGIICIENTPLVYFKQVDLVNTQEIARLQKAFWNHGGAPLLVLVTPSEVHVYSGFTRPVPVSDDHAQAPGLVDVLERASVALRQFLPSVESGEFFRRHPDFFNPAHRVDRDLLDNLQATRESLLGVSDGAMQNQVLDALLCRLVFTCYLFDRNVIGEAYLREVGLEKGSHLRDVLGLEPPVDARSALYRLFRRLGQDFNGDLFSDDLAAEAAHVTSSHMALLNDFFRATDVTSGQQSFWPYDFAAIPIEAISAIYERFLNSGKVDGAFYTPRFLAEVVLDLALGEKPVTLGHRYFDPACGSGIFLVGLFNRLAEEWKRQHVGAENDFCARELRELLCNSLCGVDISPTACRITAFSLYLAYLDQLAPREIRELQQKGHRLPTLVHYQDSRAQGLVEGNIWCGDFFDTSVQYPSCADVIVGNPPWGSTATSGTFAASWCTSYAAAIPDNQISAAFMCKAASHGAHNSRICFVLPHGILFNLSSRALAFQSSFFEQHSVDHVLNLADYQRFLFEKAGHPAVVIAYRTHPPLSLHDRIIYWTPKADWLITRAEIISIAAEDRAALPLGEVLHDLQGLDAPQIWKQHYWATSRDRRLVDRLSLYPRLRDRVQRAKERASKKPWFMAVGFQPVTKGDDPAKGEMVALPSDLFIEATSTSLDLFLLPSDCRRLSSPQVLMRNGSNKSVAVYSKPHVLVPKGFTSTAYADFDVCFQDAVRAITGPLQDRDLLIFLAALLRSSLAKFFLFHTSSNWGVSRQQIHVEELLRLPFPHPDTQADPARSWQIVRAVAEIVLSATDKAGQTLSNRANLVQSADSLITPLITEYFDLTTAEEILVNDTVDVIIPSVRPTRQRRSVPTIEPSKQAQRERYTARLCSTLNGWSKAAPSIIHGRSVADPELGIAVTILERSGRDADVVQEADSDMLAALHHLQHLSTAQFNTFELVRSVKVFDRNRLYITKPIGRRYWTETSALNDADEIAGSLLMNTARWSAQ